MYCPKCTIAIEPNGMKTCPYCATPLVEIPAPSNTAPIDYENRQPPAGRQPEDSMQGGTPAAHDESLFPSVKEKFFSLASNLSDTVATVKDAPPQRDIPLQDRQNSTSFDHKQTATAPASDQNMAQDSIFGLILDATIQDASTKETSPFQASDGSSGRHQSQSRELLDTAFEKMQLGDQSGRAPGSKSLAITALMGVILLLSVIGTGLYYLNHTALHETALHRPAKILILPSSEAPAPTLRNEPLIEQQSQEGTAFTAQDGSQAGQEIPAYQTPAPDAARLSSESPEPNDFRRITTKQAPAAGSDEPQKNTPSSGEGLSVTGTSQAPTAVMHASPRENKNDSSGTNPAMQNGRMSPSANSRTNSESGSHILLCGSFQSREKALKLAAKIKAKGYLPFVERADLGSKGIWYRIKIAGFSTKDAAEKVRDELNGKLKVAAIVVKSK